MGASQINYRRFKVKIDNNDAGNNQNDQETAPIDQIEDRVQADIKRAEGRAKEAVGQGMQDKALEREGREQIKEAEKELKQHQQ
jgi:uncharacterized protein YjbJ (UPF0337 family)